MVPEAGRAHRFPQVIAGGHHRLPDRLHCLDEQLVDPVRISFGIEHRTRENDPHDAVTFLGDTAPWGSMRNGLWAEPVVVHAPPGIEGNVTRVSCQP